MQTITTIDGRLAESALRDAGRLPTTIGGFDYCEGVSATTDFIMAWNDYETDGRYEVEQVSEIRERAPTALCDA